MVTNNNVEQHETFPNPNRRSGLDLAVDNDPSNVTLVEVPAPNGVVHPGVSVKIYNNGDVPVQGPIMLKIGVWPEHPDLTLDPDSPGSNGWWIGVPEEITIPVGGSYDTPLWVSIAPMYDAPYEIGVVIDDYSQEPEQNWDNNVAVYKGMRPQT